MPLDLHRYLFAKRPLAARVARALRVALLALLVLGLTPGIEEALETVVHLVHDGHLPHSASHEAEAATEACAQPDEHGCTPLSHHCKCCVSVAALPATSAPLPVLALLRTAREPRARSERGPPNAGLKPGLFPPIA